MAAPAAAIGASSGNAVKEGNGVLSATSDPPTAPHWSVAKVLADNNLPNPASPPSTPMPFFHLIERLKTTPREGWRRFFTDPHGESIADHMYRMAIMTMFAPKRLRDRGLDAARCTRMALVHDMAESLVGDITPVDGVGKEEKSRREKGTIDWLTGRLLGLEKCKPQATDGSDIDRGSQRERGGEYQQTMVAGGREIAGLWQEYEDSSTLEAKFVHDVDKIELLLQMLEYERSLGRKVDLGEFTGVVKRIELAEMREWAAEILDERLELWKGHEKENLLGLEVGKKLRERVESEQAQAGQLGELEKE